MFCTNCGARQNDDAKFCTNCGATLTPLEPVKPAPAPAPNDAGRVEGGSASSGERVQRQQSMPQKKRGGVGRVVAIVVILLALAGVGAGAFLTKGFGLLGVIPKGSVNDYSWSELSRISEEIVACESDEAALQVAQSYNLVGTDGQLDGTQTKSFMLTDGTPAEAAIIGFRHDDRTDGGKAGITFVLKGCITVHAMNAETTNVGGWEQSEMRAYLNNDMLARLPEDLCGAVAAVDKSTNNLGGDGVARSVTKTSDSLWLLSTTEVFGSEDEETEGSQYALYSSIGSDDVRPDALVKDIANEGEETRSMTWWLRSPTQGTDSQFDAINSKGSLQGGDSQHALGVVFGFCL